MRRRVLEATITAVTVAVVLLGVPLAVFGMLMVRDAEHGELELRANAIARSVERRLTMGEALDDAMLEPWVGGDDNIAASILVVDPDGERYQAGPDITGPTSRASAVTT